MRELPTMPTSTYIHLKRVAYYRLLRAFATRLKYATYFEHASIDDQNL
jgi:hypothetical protein